MEVPTLCTRVPEAEQANCRRSNERWLIQCGEWQAQRCGSVTGQRDAASRPGTAGPEANLLRALAGKWCYRGMLFGNETVTINGTSVSIREGVGSNSGVVRVVGEREFQFSLRSGQ